MKRGPLSNKDKQTIKDMRNKKSATSTIAKKIKRTEASVSKYLDSLDNQLSTPIKKKDKTQFFHKKGASIMTENESMRADESKAVKKKKKNPNIHKIK